MGKNRYQIIPLFFQLPVKVAYFSSRYNTINRSIKQESVNFTGALLYKNSTFKHVYVVHITLDNFILNMGKYSEADSCIVSQRPTY